MRMFEAPELRTLGSRILYLRPWLKCSDGLEGDSSTSLPSLAPGLALPGSALTDSENNLNVVFPILGGHKCQS